MSAQPQVMRPFRDNTRQRRQDIDSLTWATSSTLTRELPRVGYLNRIWVQLQATVALSSAGALHTRGAHNIVNRFKVNLNLGSNLLFDCSGPMAAVYSDLQQRGANVRLAGVGATTADADIYSAPVAMGNNSAVLTWCIPVALNNGDEFDIGLIDLQSSQTRVTLEITTGAPTDYSTNATTVTGTFYVAYEYYEIPYESDVAQPPFVIVRTLEESVPINAVGDVTYEIPKMGILYQLVNEVILNSSRSNSIDSQRLTFNRTDTIYNDRRWFTRARNRFDYAWDPATGIYIHDLWHGSNRVSTGDLRDAIDTERVSTIQDIVTVSSGASLGSSGTN